MAGPRLTCDVIDSGEVPRDAFVVVDPLTEVHEALHPAVGHGVLRE